MSSSPFKYIVKVPALMQGIEIRVWPTVIFDPIECHYPHVAIAHEFLTQDIRAVV